MLEGESPAQARELAPEMCYFLVLCLVGLCPHTTHTWWFCGIIAQVNWTWTATGRFTFLSFIYAVSV